MAGNESLILALPSAALVFGMEWLPLLGARVQRQGVRLARQHKATHMVLAGESAGSVGAAMCKGADAAGKKTMYSAAQNVAQLFPVGTVALLLKLDAVGYWLVAVHEGAVVARTDRIYPLSVDADPVLAELRLAYPHLQVLGEPQAPDPPDLAAIESASSSHSRLRTLSRWAAVLPRPVLGFVLVLALVFLAPRLAYWLQPQPAAAVSVPQADLRQAWRLALEQAFQDHFVHGVRGTGLLLDAFYQLPVHVGGWVLRQAECLAQGHDWRCHANYERHGVKASNAEFLGAAPEHWAVEFVSMDLAQPAWAIPAAGLPLLAVALKTTKNHERDLFSALQDIKPAFVQMQIGKSAPLVVPALVGEQGEPLPRLPGSHQYLSRPLRLAGPLRSGGLLLPHTESIYWRKAGLVLHQVDSPGLKNSGLNLSLEGVLYEVDADPGHAVQNAAFIPEFAYE